MNESSLLHCLNLACSNTSTLLPVSLVSIFLVPLPSVFLVTGFNHACSLPSDRKEIDILFDPRAKTDGIDSHSLVIAIAWACPRAEKRERNLRR